MADVLWTNGVWSSLSHASFTVGHPQKFINEKFKMSYRLLKMLYLENFPIYDIDTVAK